MLTQWVAQHFSFTSANTFALDITEKGIEELSFRLGVNSEIDLRMNDSGNFPSHRNEFGFIEDGMIDGIAYHNCPLDWTQSDMMKESRPMIGEIFHLLADKGNYPIYLHCSYGVDRTGTTCYILEAVLGLNETQLQSEFALSGWKYSYKQEYADKIKNGLNDYEGDTIRQRAVSYLLSCGITQQQIDTLRDIYLED